MSGNIVFSLPDRFIEKLKERAIDGDKSLSTTAKRLLINLLKGSPSPVPDGDSIIASANTNTDTSDNTNIIVSNEGIDRSFLDSLAATVASLDGTVAELHRTVNHQGQRAIDLAGRVEAIEGYLAGLSCPLAIEPATFEMLAGSSVFKSEEEGKGVNNNPAPEALTEGGKCKKKPRESRESPKSKDRPTFTTDLSIEEIRAKLTAGEGLTHAEFIKHRGLSVSPRTVGDWPVKSKKSIGAGTPFTPREYPSLQAEWEYRQGRWHPIESGFSS